MSFELPDDVNWSKEHTETLLWMMENPEFEEKPATIAEFLGPHYLNTGKAIRERVKEELITICGEDVHPPTIVRFDEAILTGGIGWGKTTVASILAAYFVHWLLCLKDPQGYFNLLSGDKIAVAFASIDADQARDVIFSSAKTRIDQSRWFPERYPPNPKFTARLEFDKGISIIPGDSSENTYKGYNVIAGIIDEADSHKMTAARDYAMEVYKTLSARITSRFDACGFLLVIGSKEKSDGFIAKREADYKRRVGCYVQQLKTWDAKTDNLSGKNFFFDVKRKTEVSRKEAQGLDQVIKVPVEYREKFLLAPETALKDFAGIPPDVGDPFITLTDKIDTAFKQYEEKYGFGSAVDVNGELEPSFHGRNSIPRVAHIDIGVTRDAAGVCVGHCAGFIEVEAETKPVITVDVATRYKAPQGGEVFIPDLRRFLYLLINEKKLNIVKVTYDGFESRETSQQLRRKGISAGHLSVDKEVAPYYDLKDALYEDRLLLPNLKVRMFVTGEKKQVPILYKELRELQFSTTRSGVQKIDHSPYGSKDVADCCAGIVHNIMKNNYLQGQVSSIPMPSRNSERASSLAKKRFSRIFTDA